MEVAIKKRKIYNPSPGDVFFGEDGERYLAIMSHTGQRLYVSLESWIAYSNEDITPQSPIDSLLILTEDE